MQHFDIETYLNSLDENVEEIYVPNRGLTHLPSLKRFTNLKTLVCYNNRLTSLPELNESLQYLLCDYNELTSLPKLNANLLELHCNLNELTSLPELNENLQYLCCDFNELTDLPKLNENLIHLVCNNNKLTSLPELNANLKYLNCQNNQLTSLPELNDGLKLCICVNNPICEIIHSIKTEEIRTQIRTLHYFRSLYYSLKFKKQFRDILWIKIREPRIMKQFHPDNIFMADAELECMF